MSAIEENPYLAPAAAAADGGQAAPTAHYGWVHVAVAAAAMVATLPGRTHGLGLVTEPLIEELRIDRSLFANINLWATLIGAAFCLPCGSWIDRFGTRNVLTAVVVALGCVVTVMSRVETWPMLFLAVLLTRGFGQSMLSVASLALVGKSFPRRLNVAMGVYSVLVGLGFGFSFKPVGACVLEFGWRQTWCGIGLALLAIMAPLAWFLVLRNEGRAIETAADTTLLPGAQATARASVAGHTLLQALGSPCFWIFAAASSLYGMISSSISLFNQSILDERGFDPATFHTLGSVGFAAGISANLLGGLAASRLRLNWLLAGAMFVLAASMAAFPHVGTLALNRLLAGALSMLGFSPAVFPLVGPLGQVYAYTLAMGLAGGTVTVCFFTVWGQAFGQTHLGKIQGAAQLLTVVASAFGPLLAAWCLRATNSYTPMFYALAPVVLMLGIAAWLVPLPGSSPAHSSVARGLG
ncbi:MAG TPA: MFS transporter [Pirellulales bacterium]|nr:MFS transporter [Pirellulales bacterium]